MKGRLGRQFITLGDVYIAYRKSKAEAYYENTHFHALAYAEFEQNLHSNLVELHRRLFDREVNWPFDLESLGDYAYLPKSIDSSAWGNDLEGHFRALDPLLDWEQRYKESHVRASAKFRLVIRPSVVFQVISTLWVMKVGHYFDEIIDSNVSYGNRLRRTYRQLEDFQEEKSTVNLSSTGLFVPYFSAYREWRENGLSKMEESLNQEKNILAITMDVEQFYHRVSPKFLLRKKFLETFNIKLSSEEELFTKQLLAAIETWYKSTPDHVDRPDGAIPVGLSASKIIANVLLADFDKMICDRMRPIYYGRYVDDVFLVLDNSDGLSAARQVMKKLSQALEPYLQIKEGNYPLDVSNLLCYYDCRGNQTWQRILPFATSLRPSLQMMPAWII